MGGVMNLLVMIYSFLIANIILGVVLCFTSSYSLMQNKKNFYWLHITVLSVSAFELILSALFIFNEQYQQFLFAISTQLLWSCALLYTFFHHAQLKKRNDYLQQELEKHLNLYEEIKSMALSDGLTNIANRRSFDMFLKTELRRATSLCHPVSLIILDLDKFKIFNDTFGHIIGDKLLSQIGQILRQNVRQIDLPARYGGEEFSIILPTSTLEEATVLAEKLRKAIEESYFPDNVGNFTAKITASFGIATYDPNIILSPPDAEKIISIADKALYKAKHNGRNCIFGANIFQ
jgi:diguanylate cyclase (GGDEF)-like protein